MTRELVIKAKFKQLLPHHSVEELEQLEANIVAEGRVREPLVVWQHNGHGVIVDGMTRYAIASRLGVPYTHVVMEFADEDEAELWILENQLGRRNLLKPHEVRKIRGELYNRLKRKDGGHGDQKTGSGGQNVPPIIPENIGENAKTAAEVVADKTGVTPRTVKRDGAFVAAVDSMVSPLRNLVDRGELTLTNAEAKRLAAQDNDVQQQVARNVRTGAPLAEAMAKAGVKSAQRKRPENGPIVPGEGECPQGGRHEWESDGNGERYCGKCKEDHPDNLKTPKASAAKYLGGIAATVAKCRCNIDDVVREFGRHASTDEIMQHLDEAYKRLKKWEGSEK